MATSNVDPAASSDLPPVPPAKPAEDSELVRLRAAVDRGNKDLDELKRRFTAPPAPAASPVQPMSSADMAKEFYKDPVGHAIAIANKVMDDRAKANGDPNRETLIQIAKDSVRSKDPSTFDKYYLEIEAAVNTVAPQFHGNINVWENAFKMARGSHIDEILAERGEAAKKAVGNGDSAALHVREGGGPASPSARPAQPPAGTELSQDEKRTARKLGITEDQYKAGKVHLEGQNDPVRSPVGPSSWDSYITFSSKDRKRRLRAEALAARGGK